VIDYDKHLVIKRHSSGMDVSKCLPVKYFAQSRLTKQSVMSLFNAPFKCNNHELWNCRSDVL